MTDLKSCPSCREPMDHPSGDGCANMTAHKEKAMTDEQLIARLDHWIEQQVLVLVDSDLLPIRDRIEALTEQRDAARQDAKEAEAYAGELEAKVKSLTKHHANMADPRYWEGRYRDEKNLLAMAVEALRSTLNFIENTEGEMGVILGCGDKARNTLAEIKLQSSEFATQKGESHE